MLKLYSSTTSYDIAISDHARFIKDEHIELLSTYNKNLVFDVGANIGNRSELYLSLFNKVIAFEPQIDCINHLKSRFTDNRIMIENIALSDHEDVKDIYICKDANGISTLSKDYTRNSRFVNQGYKWKDTYQVKCKTLDQMIQKYGLPDYCKIDVEGFEYQVISGLNQKIPLLYFECNIDQLDITVRCLEYLDRLGYTKFNYTFGERGLYIFKNWLSLSSMVNELQNLKEDQRFNLISGVWGDIYCL